MDQEIVALARRLPVKDDAKNIARLLHTEKNGFIVTLRVAGDLLGYAEVYRLREIPTYPVIPFPVDEPEGKILYCFAAVCERGFIKDLMKQGFYLFPTVEKIAYHRRKHGNRLFQIRREDV